MIRGNCRFTFIDLFAGAGGFSLGFDTAGFTCIGAVENNRQASSTYQVNFPGHAALPLARLGPVEGNVLSLTKETFHNAARRMELSEVDVLLTGPPCQGF